ncbi:MAG: hypothetical protein U0132_09760 [Gemmatimonadaceae bacterium]
MTRHAGWRRLVAGLTLATMTPWITGCYQHNTYPRVNAVEAVGRKVLVKMSAPVPANVILQDGSRAVLDQAVQAEGELVLTTSDSIRLRDVVVRMTDKSQSQYREAGFPATQTLSIVEVRLYKARTAVSAIFVAVAAVAVLALLMLHDLDVSPS